MPSVGSVWRWCGGSSAVETLRPERVHIGRLDRVVDSLSGPAISGHPLMLTLPTLVVMWKMQAAKNRALKRARL